MDVERRSLQYYIRHEIRFRGLRLDPHGSDVRIGEMLEVIPVHSCPVANLVDELVVVRGGAVVDRWPVAARGCVT